MTPTLRVLIGTMFALSFLFATPIEAGQKMTTAVGNMSHEGKKGCNPKSQSTHRATTVAEGWLACERQLFEAVMTLSVR